MTALGPEGQGGCSRDSSWNLTLAMLKMPEPLGERSPDTEESGCLVQAGRWWRSARAFLLVSPTTPGPRAGPTTDPKEVVKTLLPVLQTSCLRSPRAGLSARQTGAILEEIHWNTRRVHLGAAET